MLVSSRGLKIKMSLHFMFKIDGTYFFKCEDCDQPLDIFHEVPKLIHTKVCFDCWSIVYP